MKSNLITWLPIVLLIAYIGGDVYTTKQADNKLQLSIDSIKAAQMAATFKVSAVSAGLDSLKAHQLASIQAIIYLDSCQQQRSIKVDRAERRGKFVGGLLRSLFPGL